ncbi:uncharacterized protein [Dermacentor andersoni]|uniref:uncharacterized protein n=1 Tax=Dermacentor andersoni TaxID=34620 RepID=UPI003B3AFED3
MLFRPLNNPTGSITALPFTFPSSTSASGLRGDPRTLMHWAVSFLFPGEEDFLVCEATRDGLTGELVGHSSWRNEAALKTIGPSQVKLGSYQVTQDQVHAALKDFGDLEPYDVTKNSCQTFVVQLLERLGINVPDDVVTCQAAVAKSPGMSSPE